MGPAYLISTVSTASSESVIKMLNRTGAKKEPSSVHLKSYSIFIVWHISPACPQDFCEAACYVLC